MVWREMVLQRIFLNLLILGKTPRRVYKKYVLKRSSSPNKIKTYCCWIRPRGGLIQNMVQREVFPQSNEKQRLLFNETPQRDYKSYVLKRSTSPKHIGTFCFWIMPRNGLIQTMIWREVVPRSILELIVFESDPAAGLYKRCFGEKLFAKAY